MRIGTVRMMEMMCMDEMCMCMMRYAETSHLRAAF